MRTLILTLLVLISSVAGASLDPKDYIFAVVETESSLQVFVNTKAHWEEYGELIDSYPSKEADEFIHEQMLSVDLCNVMESTFEPCGQVYSRAAYIKALIQKGFTHDMAFESAMRENR